VQIQKGSLLLFRLFGVNVFLHWSWALVAAFQIWRDRQLSARLSIPILIAEYLCLFLIVLMHEFGHALACKSVGGKAERIVLWPLGGVAYVQPPPRPGALLWSIAAGPLVNVLFLPLTIIPAYLAGSFSGIHSLTAMFLFDLAVTNAVLLVFNMLPIYPLDGGQILQALAWFIFGRAVSLIIAASVGLVGAALLAALALYASNFWLGLVVFFLVTQSLRGIKIGRTLYRLESAPRYPQVRCPNCGKNPPAGPFWNCPCGCQLDTFATGGQCPKCQRLFDTTTCPECGQASLLTYWQLSPMSTIPPQQNF
jgi:Zn-dependent protease